MLKIEIPTSYGLVQILSLGKKDVSAHRIYPQDAKGWRAYTHRHIERNLEKKNLLSPKHPPHSIVSLNQVHGNQIFFTDNYRYEDGSVPMLDGDGLGSQDENEILAIRTADCVPVMVWCYNRPYILSLHIGWKGVQSGILDKFFDIYMVPTWKFGFFIGPCIRGRNYEVGREVAEIFRDCPSVLRPLPAKPFDYTGNEEEFNMDVANRGFTPGEDDFSAEKYLLDLPGYIQYKILSRNPEAVVMDSGEDTFHSQDWFSHRSKEEGRNIHAIRFLALS